MSRTEGKNLRVVLYEGPGSTPLADDARFDTLSALLDSGFEVTRPVSGQQVAPADDAPVLVLGLLDRLETPPIVPPDQEVHFRNLAEGDPLEAARFASCAASFCVEAVGVAGIPTRRQVEARLRSHG